MATKRRKSVRRRSVRKSPRRRLHGLGTSPMSDGMLGASPEVHAVRAAWAYDSTKRVSKMADDKSKSRDCIGLLSFFGQHSKYYGTYIAEKYDIEGISEKGQDIVGDNDELLRKVVACFSPKVDLEKLKQDGNSVKTALNTVKALSKEGHCDYAVQTYGSANADFGGFKYRYYQVKNPPADVHNLRMSLEHQRSDAQDEINLCYKKK